MAKKKKAKSSENTGRVKGQKVYNYLKAPKVDLESKHMLRIVHDAAKKVKSGTVAEITEAALKLGFGKVTGQDPLVQTGVMLNRLATMGSVKKAGSDKVAGTKKKKFKLKKS